MSADVVEKEGEPTKIITRLLRSVAVNKQHVYAPVRSGHTDVTFTVANNTLSQGVRRR